MHPSQLDLLLPEQAALLIRKKRFWGRTMWISSSTSIVFLFLGLSKPIISLVRNLLGIPPYDPDLPYGHQISNGIIAFGLAIPIASFFAIIFLIALLRYLSLPKLPSKP